MFDGQKDNQFSNHYLPIEMRKHAQFAAINQNEALEKKSPRKSKQ